MKTPKERFLSKVSMEPMSGCWIWAAAENGIGYGYATLKGKSRLAHRVAYELFVGPIPEGEGHHGICVCHPCDNSICVNPKHLFLGSQKENVRDRDRKEKK